MNSNFPLSSFIMKNGFEGSPECRFAWSIVRTGRTADCEVVDYDYLDLLRLRNCSLVIVSHFPDPCMAQNASVDRSVLVQLVERTNWAAADCEPCSSVAATGKKIFERRYFYSHSHFCSRFRSNSLVAWPRSSSSLDAPLPKSPKLIDRNESLGI